jgi:hypothetical protein
MSVQASNDNITVPFIRSGVSYTKNDATLLTDGGRSTDLAKYTLLAQVAASKKWVPFTDETATDGTAVAKGVYLGDAVAAADIAAGDVTGFGPILVGGACTIDNDQLVIENSKTLDTVVGAASVEAHRVEDDLNEIGIFVEATVDIDGYEN